MVNGQWLMVNGQRSARPLVARKARMVNEKSRRAIATQVAFVNSDIF
jgi:hypothetical protein